MTKPRGWLVVALVGALGSAGIGCGGSDRTDGSTEEPGTSDGDPSDSSGGEARVETGSSEATLDPDLLPLRVYTWLLMSPHFSRSNGRWYRRTSAGGWEQATCSRSLLFDPGAVDSPPTCSAWTEVAPRDVATVERIAAERREVTCSEQPAVCAELGLEVETPPALP